MEITKKLPCGHIITVENKACKLPCGQIIVENGACNDWTLTMENANHDEIVMLVVYPESIPFIIELFQEMQAANRLEET